jgi:hypothetical protein
MNSESVENNETELWKERVDDLKVVLEDLREKQATLYAQLHRAEDEARLLRDQNRELMARIDRLTLHLQQGVEL